MNAMVKPWSLNLFGLVSNQSFQLGNQAAGMQLKWYLCMHHLRWLRCCLPVELFILNNWSGPSWSNVLETKLYRDCKNAVSRAERECTIGTKLSTENSRLLLNWISQWRCLLFCCPDAGFVHHHYLTFWGWCLWSVGIQIMFWGFVWVCAFYSWTIPGRVEIGASHVVYPVIMTLCVIVGKLD